MTCHEWGGVGATSPCMASHQGTASGECAAQRLYEALPCIASHQGAASGVLCAMQRFYEAAGGGSWLLTPARACHTSFMDAGLLLNRLFDWACCAGCGRSAHRQARLAC